MRDHLLLYINGQPHQVRGPAVFQPLTTFLRETLRLTGTKIVCAEGDCGSCTVLLGRPTPGQKSLRYAPVCGCIQYLAQLDASHILTIEGLADTFCDSRLSPIQKSLIKNHGTQCGFCTPGFVVALTAHLEENKAPTRHSLTRALTGNLCRCTGYDSILAAGLDIDTAALRPINSLHDTPEITAHLAALDQDPVELRAGDQHFFKPVTLRDAAIFRAAHADALLIAGGTDIGVQLNKRMRSVTTLLSTAALHDLESLRIENNQILAGARASLADLEKLAAHHLPDYARMLANFGSPLIKNAGTLGGNIANGSPIGDTMPALFVLNAEVELAGPAATRRVNINSFYTGYRKSVLKTDELIVGVRIPLPAKTDLFKIYKISRRKDLDISTFTAAFWTQLANNTIADIRIAYGGVGPVILRLPKTEAFLKTAPFAEESFRAAGPIARSEITPLSDVRGEADYRLQLAENILLKFFAETSTRANIPALASNGDH
jgi:xanthine dehydrogenase small subunit